MKREIFGSFLFILIIGVIIVSAQDNNSFSTESSSSLETSSQEPLEKNDIGDVASTNKQGNTAIKTIKEGLSNTSNELMKRLERKDAEIKKLKAENEQLKEQLKKQDEAFRAIAEAFNIPPSKVDSMGLYGMSNEIKIKIEESKYYGTSFLSESDIQFVEDVCVDDPRVIRVIKSYDSFVKQNRANP